MDVKSYLRKQGWLGDGHSLDHSGKGIKKPLLVSKKVDVLGVGLNKHAAVSDQWWLRAYDQGLKDFGTGKENLLGQVQKHGINRGGLYGRFVKGEAVPGTIGTSTDGTPTGNMTPAERAEELQGDMIMLETEAPASMVEPPSKKRKRGDKYVEQSEKRARRRLEKEAQKAEDLKRGPTEPRTAAPQTMKQDTVIVGDLSTARARALERKRQAQIAKKLRRTMNPEERRAFKKEQQEERKQLKAERAKAAAAVNKGAVKAPIVGVQTRPSTVAEKKLQQNVEQEKIDRYRAAKQGMDLSRYRRAVAAGELQDSSVEVKKKTLSDEKLQEYTKRAQEKGISIEEYIKRREEKYAAKQGEKLGQETAAPPASGLGFVIDTAGDANLTTDPPAKRIKDKDLPQLPDFANALVSISKNEPVLITESDGTETFRWDPSLPMPQDPQLWQGVIIKQLPKLVRKARREWMAVRREAKKAGNPSKPAQKKSKGTKKVEIREDFVWKILFKSRQFAKDGAPDGKKPSEVRTDVGGINNVPLVTVAPVGTFTKGEIASARTVANHMLKVEKREMKATKGEKKKQLKAKRAVAGLKRR
ncbi:hypothetical protein B0A55_04638 [Friedmanniomyces simplex]|uniref:G-patch domain-containing protein n=1 Tax=Friedmanniomyces simplex TaxID=329884 RepID=A0A4U0XIE0_9PEZI|nr:hypothetical protein B0A55_04638 [Friedmanniomyces simplex]